MNAAWRRQLQRFSSPLTSCQRFCGLSKRRIQSQRQLSGKRNTNFSLSLFFFFFLFLQTFPSHCAPTHIQRWQWGHLSVYLSKGRWVTPNLAKSRAKAGAVLRPLNHFSVIFFFIAKLHQPGYFSAALRRLALRSALSRTNTRICRLNRRARSRWMMNNPVPDPGCLGGKRDSMMTQLHLLSAFSPSPSKHTQRGDNVRTCTLFLAPICFKEITKQAVGRVSPSVQSKKARKCDSETITTPWTQIMCRLRTLSKGKLR